MGRDRNDGGGVKAFLIFLVPSPCIMGSPLPSSHTYLYGSDFTPGLV